MAENAVAFEKLTALVRQRVSSRRFDSAVSWARVAAAFATTNPTGSLRDVRLEGALDEVSSLALAPAPSRPAASGDRPRVLHVLSEGHRIGGHVGMALRWVEADESSLHHVLVTRPGCESRPLADAVRLRGGRARVLDGRSLVKRASYLRAATTDAEIVVCHTHPDDPVPAVAFGGDYAGPPVVMVNHADHVFWLGAGNVSSVLNLRDAGAEAAITARGYPRENVLVAPAPLPAASRQLDRDSAKRRIGIDPAQIVLLTLARNVKYAPAPWHPGFVDVLGPAIVEHPQTTLLAVGPDPNDSQWADLVRRAPGRVLVPGPQPDPSVHLDAADLYLDSFPFASNTSMLEAATRDLPILTSRRHTGMSRLMSSSGPLDDLVVGAVDTASYRHELGRLVADRGLRARTGAQIGDAVRRRHGAASWSTRLLSVYDHALTATPVRERHAPEHDPDDLAQYAEALLGIEAQAPLLWTIGFSRDGFDTPDRLSAAARTTLVRAAQKLRGTGPGRGAAGGASLIPSGGLR